MDAKNLLVLISDEHNFKMMGCAGHPLVKTPNLDALAASGTRFANAYTPSPICVPARACLATGRYVHQTGYWDNSLAYDGRVPGWGHRLQAGGVRVESIGKLHYRRAEDPCGFDEEHIPMHIRDGVGMLAMSIRHQFPDFVTPPRRRATIAETAGAGDSEYIAYDRRIADIAVQWLRDAAASTTPWVLFVSFATPHYPLTAPQEYFDLYAITEMPDALFGAGSSYATHPWLADQLHGGMPSQRDQRQAMAAYLGLVTFMDAQVGRVLDALDAAGLRGATRIVYTSDHGENAGKRGFWGKSNHYEEVVHIPMIIAGEGVAAGAVCATPASLIDIHPSVLHGVGIPADGSDQLGTSLFDLACAPDDGERVVFSEYHATGSPSAAFMIRKGRFKLIHYVGFEPELFDLDADPHESGSLADDANYAGILAEMQAILRGIVDPEDADRRANEAQRRLIEKGGPQRVYDTITGSGLLYTPAPRNA